MEHLKKVLSEGGRNSAPKGRRRLGFSIRIMGREEGFSGTLAPDNPLALGMNLMRLRDTLVHCRSKGIRMYRMHGNAAPAPGSDLVGLWRMYEGEANLLAALIREAEIRLSFHPYNLVNLSSPSEDQIWHSTACLSAEVSLFDALQLGAEAVIVLHVGGVYDDPRSSCDRFIRRYEALPEQIRVRVVLEHDDRLFSVSDAFYIHDRCGVPLVFDWQHHQVFNPQVIPWLEALARCTASWPSGMTPKIHFSSPRTELRSMNGRIKVPSWTEHSDYVQPFEFIRFLQESAELDYDIMLECKARDLALLKLRNDLHRYAPDLAISVL